MSNKSRNKKRRWVKLPKGSIVNQRAINELETLLSMTSPQTLARSLNHVFYMYLFYETDHPKEFKYIAEDFYILQEFFSGISGADRGKINNEISNPEN